MDWVPAHFSRSPGLAKFDGSALYEHADPKQGEHPDWGTLILITTATKCATLVASALYWLQEFTSTGSLRKTLLPLCCIWIIRVRKASGFLNEYGGRENLGAVKFLARAHCNFCYRGSPPGCMIITKNQRPGRESLAQQTPLVGWDLGLSGIIWVDARHSGVHPRKSHRPGCITITR
jgi:1,4-alpha-glucan branching enzyme